MHIIHLYNKIKNNASDDIQPRTFIFAAKAAPAYLIAKSVIKLINTLSEKINNDPEVNDKIKIISFYQIIMYLLLKKLYLLQIFQNKFLLQDLKHLEPEI